MEPVDTVLLLLRLWLAAVMLAHGIRHARTLDGTAGWFESLGFRHARLQARGSAAGEIAVGLGLAFGFLTTLAAAGLVTTMAVAFWSVHRKAGFWVFARPDEGWEYVGTLSVAAVALATIGPGELSVDHLLEIDLAGWTGLGLSVAGVALAAVQLAATWREPGKARDR